MRRVILAIVTTAAGLALLLSFKTHAQSAPGISSPAAALGSPAPGNGAGTPSASAARSAAGTGTAKTATVTGAAWPTIYGPVQVKITVTGGKITAVTAVEYPTNTPRDYQINEFAIPQLNAETLAAGSARIDAVSGATYTSQGYLGSLQNALNKAGL
jgi:uncharacterized protein with FMN-binding domain